MDPSDAKYHMKRCVDSGLWVARDDSIFEDDDEEEGKDGNGEDAGAKGSEIVKGQDVK